MSTKSVTKFEPIPRPGTLSVFAMSDTRSFRTVTEANVASPDASSAAVTNAPPAMERFKLPVVIGAPPAVA